LTASFAQTNQVLRALVVLCAPKHTGGPDRDLLQHAGSGPTISMPVTGMSSLICATPSAAPPLATISPTYAGDARPIV
jgi:hypothetical protein